MLLVSGMGKVLDQWKGLISILCFHCLMKVSERYTCYPSEFDCSDVVSKCVVITFYEFYITSTIIF